MDNTFIDIQSSSIIKPNDIKCVKNEGIASDNGRGDLIIHFEIEFPNDIIKDDSNVLASILKYKSNKEDTSNCRNVILNTYVEEHHHHHERHHGPRVQECNQQ